MAKKTDIVGRSANIQSYRTGPRSKSAKNRDDILKCIRSRMLYLIEEHYVAMLIRFDIILPPSTTCTAGRRLVDCAMSNLTRDLDQAGLAHQYIGCQNQSPTDGSRYRICLLVNTHRPGHFHMVIAKLKDLLVNTGGTIDDKNHAHGGCSLENGVILHMMDPDFDRLFEQCLHWASGIAGPQSSTGAIKSFASTIPKRPIINDGFSSHKHPVLT